MIKVGVIGVGFFGKHHARIYASLPNVQLVGICDTKESIGQTIASEYDTKFFKNYLDLAEQVDALSVAVPTVKHHEIVCNLLRQGKSVLVEKPIASSIEEANEMIKIAQENSCILQVGHLERYNPAVYAVQKIVNNPRFFEIHRIGVFSARSLDVDVVLDLMIHDLDILLTLVKSEISSIHAVGIPILTSKIDIANVRIEFVNGCVANLTASRISSEKIRKIRFFQPHDYISLDYATQQVGIWSLGSQNGDFPGITEGSLPIKKDEPLSLQLVDFVKCAITKKQPEVNGQAGRRALELALNVLQKIQEHAQKVKL